MKRLSVRQVDEKIYRIIEKVNEYTREGKQYQQHHAISYCNDLGLDFMTFYNRIRKNKAFGLQYDKKTKFYSVNTDTPSKCYEMQLESAETITLEAIAEKTKRPLTISEIENTEHYKALASKNEVMQAVVDDLKKDLVNVGKLQWELKEQNETKKEAFFRLIKNRDIQLSFWTGWLINTILTLIVSELLK